MKIDKRLFDKEYSTMFLQEFRYLEKQGIKPSFIKDTEGVSIFKYTKTPELFEALRCFYLSKK